MSIGGDDATLLSHVKSDQLNNLLIVIVYYTIIQYYHVQTIFVDNAWMTGHGIERLKSWHEKVPAT